MDPSPLSALWSAFQRAGVEGSAAGLGAWLKGASTTERARLEHNLRKVRERGWRLVHVSTDVAGARAVVRFRLLDGAGLVVDEGLLQCELQDGQWRLVHA
ncbi:MAG: hypothetical protein AB2A00_29570 [Myxococcota bacterium]